eukprot:3904038-Prymnesium_polylepis.2
MAENSEETPLRGHGGRTDGQRRVFKWLGVATVAAGLLLLTVVLNLDSPALASDNALAVPAAASLLEVASTVLAPRQIGFGGDSAETSRIMTALLELPVVGDTMSHPHQSQRGIYFAQRNELLGGRPDSATSCKLFEIPDAATTAYHLHKIEPIVDQRLSATGLVHHMDMAFCDKNVLARVNAEDDDTCELLMDLLLQGQACTMIQWAYDKGVLRLTQDCHKIAPTHVHCLKFLSAGALASYSTPADSGFRVGKGTPFQVMAMQVHYLRPEKVGVDQLVAQKYVDASGLRLHLGPALRPSNMGNFAFMANQLEVPPETRGFNFSSRASAQVFKHAKTRTSHSHCNAPSWPSHRDEDARMAAEF